MGNLKFNGVTIIDTDPNNLYSSKIEGVVIQTPPVYEFPSKRIDTIQIQGRNGDIIIDKDSYNNVAREYNIASVFGNTSSFIQKVRELVDWLTSAIGYARLEDSYEPDYFRLAVYRSGGQFPNFYDKATAIALKFECKPQRFLKTGENPIAIPADGIPHNIVNNTKYVALPEIIVSGGFVTIEITNPNGNTVITLTDETLVDDIILDSELQDAYTATEYVNNKISASNGFIKLYPGTSQITVTGGNGISLKPRWWVL